MGEKKNWGKSSVGITLYSITDNVGEMRRREDGMGGEGGGEGPLAWARAKTSSGIHCCPCMFPSREKNG